MTYAPGRTMPTLLPLADMAREYYDVLEGQADGLGRFVHPTYGVSHNMLYLMQINYGVGPTATALDLEWASRKGNPAR